MTPLEFVAGVVVVALALAVAIYANDHFEQRNARKMAKDAINFLRETPMTDNTKDDTKETESEELKRLRRELRQQAVRRWEKRRDAALEAAERPAHPFRIQHQAQGDSWMCQRFFTQAPNCPHAVSYIKNGYYDQRPTTPEEIDAHDPKPLSGWRNIGPDNTRFSTFDDAAKWLRAYLKPIDKEVYFTASGRQVAA